jgi:hypothetical protein
MQGMFNLDTEHIEDLVPYSVAGAAPNPRADLLLSMRLQELAPGRHGAPDPEEDPPPQAL